MGLSAELLKAIDNLGFEQASPIQSEAIPLILTGKDLVGQSQTGSGKTAAFGVPAVEKVDPKRREVQILILCPTRELAMQVADEIHKLSLFKHGVRSVPIYGGASYDRQLQALRQGVQIVIGTPGRVMDHMRRGTLKLSTVQMVILDEADRMLDMGFRDDIDVILQSVPEQRQLIFFSATLSKPIQDLIRKFAKDPTNVKIDEHKRLTVPTVEQVFYEVPRYGKKEALTRIIDLYDVKLAIIFCNTKRMVDELTDDLLAKGYLADRLHGDISQAARSRVMEKFRNSNFDILVATDVAARGIDVDDVEAVFNYDLPYDVEDYVHRIGRTGRAGRSGKAMTFVQGSEIYLISRIERYTKCKIRKEQIPSLVAVEEKRVGSFIDKLKKTLQEGKYKKHDELIQQLLEAGFSSTDISSALLHHLLGAESAGKAKKSEKAAATFTPVESNYKRDDDHKRPERRRDRSQVESGMTRLKLNVGRKNEITPGDIVGKILGVTGLPKTSIGYIEILPEHVLVDVESAYSSEIQDKLTGIQLKGIQLQVEEAGSHDVVKSEPRKHGREDRGGFKRPRHDRRDHGRPPFKRRRH